MDVLRIQVNCIYTSMCISKFSIICESNLTDFVCVCVFILYLFFFSSVLSMTVFTLSLEN